MKSGIIICVLLVSLMLLSFQSRRAKVTLLKNGNYLVTKKVAINAADAKTLSDFSMKAADETTVVNTKVYKDAVDKTVYTTTKSTLKDRAQLAKVKEIMGRYSK